MACQFGIRPFQRHGTDRRRADAAGELSEFRFGGSQRYQSHARGDQTLPASPSVGRRALSKVGWVKLARRGPTHRDAASVPVGRRVATAPLDPRYGSPLPMPGFDLLELQSPATI